MSITATKLRKNLGKYLALSSTEDVFITRNGKEVAMPDFMDGQHKPTACFEPVNVICLHSLSV